MYIYYAVDYKASELDVEKGVCVRILDKDFRVACAQEQRQALFDAAQYLDAQMRKIRKTGRVIGLERIAVMAALNITAQLLQSQQNPDDSMQQYSERLKSMQDKIDEALNTSVTKRSAPSENVELHFSAETTEEVL